MKLLVGLIIGAGLTYLYFSRLETSYKLYRTSPVAKENILVASFNAKESDDYNRKNCDIAKGLFQSQPGVTEKYMCIKK